MTLRQIRNLLLVCPPTGNDGGDCRLRKALKAAEKNADLQALLESQRLLDAHIAKELCAISPPASLSMQAAHVESILARKAVPVISLRDPAILSVAIAFILLLVSLAWLLMEKISSLPGLAEAWHMVSEGDKARRDQLENIALKMDALGDWFAMKGMDQFWAPTACRNLNVVAGRVFTTSSNVPVAMGVVNQPPMVFYAFNGPRLGIFPPKEGTWKMATREGKTIGVIGQGDSVFIAEIEGDRADLQRILQGLGSPEVRQ